MNINEFSDVALQVTEKAKALLDPGLATELKYRKKAKQEHCERMHSVLFTIWGKSPAELWDPVFGNYAIVHDPDLEMAENAPFQVRFMFFLRRKETGEGRFSTKVMGILQQLDGREGFTMHDAPDRNGEPYLVILKKLYRNKEANPAWIAQAAKDLAWLINNTLPKLRVL